MSIFVIEGHPLMREALGALLRRMSPGKTVVELEGFEGLAAAALAYGEPDLVCLELQSVDTSSVSGVPDISGLSDVPGISGIAQIRRNWPESAIVVLTSAPAGVYKDLSIKAGASAFISKSASTNDLSALLETYLPEVGNGETQKPVEKLSKRQKQLLVLLDKGMSNRDIAESLQISEHTVKVHLWRLFRRLNVKSRSQASHLARVNQLL